VRSQVIHRVSVVCGILRGRKMPVNRAGGKN
jgi:hypothetical protein